MEFKQAIEVCLRNKYADFSGRASRSEFWWFSLFTFVLMVVLYALLAAATQISSILSLIIGLVLTVVALGLIVPALAVAVRRLHDTGKSGWLILIGIIPIINIIGAWVLLVFYILPSNPASNPYGEPPAS